MLAIRALAGNWLVAWPVPTRDTPPHGASSPTIRACEEHGVVGRAPETWLEKHPRRLECVARPSSRRDRPSRRDGGRWPGEPPRRAPPAPVSRVADQNLDPT